MADYEIGRGKPPKQFSYKKGVSGNPRGRPKGRRTLSSTIEATLNEKALKRKKIIMKKPFRAALKRCSPLLKQGAPTRNARAPTYTKPTMYSRNGTSCALRRSRKKTKPM